MNLFTGSYDEKAKQFELRGDYATAGDTGTSGQQSR
jgi:hypothetical protein